jgi:8-amino-7-oxononanoate synthase
MKSSALDWMKEEIEEWQERFQYRQLHETSTDNDGTWIYYRGKRVLNLSSNNYLGLSYDTVGMEDLIGQMRSTGIGSTASRLVVGNHPLYVQAEEELARSKQAEAALIFPSGYMANVGIISSVVGRDDIVYSDRYNHASIVDGIVLSRAKMERYRHNDMDHLEALLKKADAVGTGTMAGSMRKRKKLIVTDTIFSMDGDLAPLMELVELKERYGAMLMVDEAHSGGVYGPCGEGLSYELGLQDRVDIQMGTFSKAYGCYGAYVVGSDMLKQYLVNKARSFVFTTGLPPMAVASILYSIRAVKAGSERRAHLRENAELVRIGLEAMGLDTLGSRSQIIPALVGDNDSTLKFSQALLETGIAGVAIRPPTVPEGMARVRFTVMATHQKDDLVWALQQIQRLVEERASHA